jgi:hypothetical protein
MPIAALILTMLVALVSGYRSYANDTDQSTLEAEDRGPRAAAERERSAHLGYRAMADSDGRQGGSHPRSSAETMIGAGA